MRGISLKRTIRGRWLLLGIAVEMLLLGILLANSFRLLNDAVTGQSSMAAGNMRSVMEILLSSVLLFSVGYWLTRHLAELTAAKDAAEASEARLRSITDSALDAILMMDPRGAISYWNPAAEHILGYSLEEAIGKNLHTLLAPERYHEAHSAAFGEFVRTGCGNALGKMMEFAAKRKDGREITVALSLSAVSLTGEWHALGILRDISEIKRNEAELLRAKEAAEASACAMSQSEERLKLVLDGSNDGFWDWDIPSGAVEFSSSWAEMLGYTIDEIEPNLSAWERLVHPDDKSMVLRVLNDHFEGRLPFYETEHRMLTKSGEWKWIHDRGKVVKRDSQGKPLRAVGTHADISDRKRAEQELHRINKEMASKLAELEARNREIAMLGEMTTILQTCKSVDEATGVMKTLLPQFFLPHAGALYMNDAACDLMEPVVFWGEDSLAELTVNKNDCWGIRLGKPHLDADAAFAGHCPHRNRFPGFHHLCVPLVAQGDVGGVLYLNCREEISEDIFQLAKAVADTIILSMANLKLRESLHLQSICDPLTGLYNRRYMEETLGREIMRANRSKRPLGIMMVDVDYFKSFNDTYGHETGDTVLTQVGMMLKSSVRGGDVVCRYGGEEFTIILPEASLGIARQRAEALRKGVEELVVRYAGKSLERITISVGLAAMPDHGVTAEELLREADVALYRAKQEGRNRVVVAQPILKDGSLST